MTATTDSVTEIEYRNLNGFQKTLYSNNGNTEMRFYSEKRTIGWNNNMEVRINVDESKGDSKYHFSLDKTFSFSKGIYMIVKTPNIRVIPKMRKDIRIAFTHNLMHHIHGEASFIYDQGVLQTITPKYLDDYRQYFVTDKKQYDAKIGNVPALITKTDHLKPYSLRLNPPWFFSLNDASAFPLYERCNHSKKIYFNYNFNLDISKLVRMYKRGKDLNEEKEVWIPIKFNRKYIVDGKKIKIDCPQMWGRYSNITASERDFRDKNAGMDVAIDFFDIIEIKSHDIKKYKETIAIDLVSGDPVFGLTWKAQNQTALEVNDLSNYTTNSFNHKEGCNPIVQSEIKYGNLARVSKRAHYHFDRILPEIYFGKHPFEEGYNCYFFDDKPLSLNAIGHSVVLDNIKKVVINCTLGDANTGEDSDDDDEVEIELPEKEEEKKEETPGFKVTVNLLVRKRIIFDKKRDKLSLISDDLSFGNFNTNE